MRLILFLLVFFTVNGLHAQTAPDTTAPALAEKGVVADARVGLLVAKHVEINRRGHAKGYRVQIFFGAEKQKAKEVKAKFLGRHSEIRAYEVYEVPNYKIRVGDFRTKLEAYKFLKEIQNDFPGAFIVDSEIEQPEIDPKK